MPDEIGYFLNFPITRNRFYAISVKKRQRDIIFLKDNLA